MRSDSDVKVDPCAERVKLGIVALIHLNENENAKKYVGEPFKPSRCIKASFYIPENRLNFPTTKSFRMKISMKLVYQYMGIFFNFYTTSSHLHPLQVENCDSLRLVVDDDDNGKFRDEGICDIFDYTVHVIIKSIFAG